MTHPGLRLCGLFLFLCLIIPREACPAAPEQPSNGLIDRYQAALTADPGNLTLHYLLGVALLDSGRDRAAMEEFRRAYPAYRSDLDANYNLAVTSLRLADLDSAQLYLDQAEMLGAAEQPQIYPLADLYFKMAVLAQEQGRNNETIRYYRKVLELAPGRHEIYRQLGDLYAQRGETDLAVEAFHLYLEKVPDDPLSRDYLFALEFNQAQELLDSGDLESASRHLSTALEIHPESPAALYYLGYIAYSQRSPTEALELLHRAHDVGDASLKASIRPLLYNCCLELRESGQTAQALLAATLLADNPDADFKELFLAGTLNLEQGRYRHARGYLLRARRLDPQHSGTLQNLIAAESGAFSEWLAMARQQLAGKDFAAASAALTAASELQPDNRQVVTLRKRLERQRQEQAKDHFKAAAAALNGGDFGSASDQVHLGLILVPVDPEGVFLRERIAGAFAAELENQQQIATAALNQGHWQTAEQALNAILTLAPDDQRAISDLQRVEQGRQENLRELLAAAQTALDQGEPEQAHDIFKQALADSPGLPAAEDGLATAEQLLANRVSEYLRNGRKALNRDHFAEARDWFTRAFQIDAGGSSRSALRELDASIKTRTRELLDEANRLADAGDFKRADDLYAKVLVVSPENGEAEAARQRLSSRSTAIIAQQLNAADRALLGQRFAEARSGYRKVLAVAPDNPEAQAGIARVRSAQADTIDQLTDQLQSELDRGELPAAAKTLARALAIAPFDAGVRQQQERLESLRLSGAQPGDEQSLYLQGVALYTQGHYAEAIEAWKTVLTLDPEHSKARQNIDKTRRKMRQIEEYRSG